MESKKKLLVKTKPNKKVKRELIEETLSPIEHTKEVGYDSEEDEVINELISIRLYSEDIRFDRIKAKGGFLICANWYNPSNNEENTKNYYTIGKIWEDENGKWKLLNKLPCSTNLGELYKRTKSV